MVEGGQSRLSRMVDSSSGAVLPPIALVEDEPVRSDVPPRLLPPSLSLAFVPRRATLVNEASAWPRGWERLADVPFSSVRRRAEPEAALLTVGGDEPRIVAQGLTRKKVLDFLAAHAAYELIPESGKVVVIDVNFSVRHAFHALHDEAIASAPLWDGERHALVGVISASDFIATLQRLRAAAAAPGGYALSEAEMDRHTIRAMRALAAADGHEPKPLVFCRETDTFAAVRTASVPRLAGRPALRVVHASRASAVPLWHHCEARCGRVGKKGQHLWSQ